MADGVATEGFDEPHGGGRLPASGHFGSPIVESGDPVHLVLGDDLEAHTPTLEVAVGGHAVEQVQEALVARVAADFAEQFFDGVGLPFQYLNEATFGVKQHAGDVELRVGAAGDVQDFKEFRISHQASGGADVSDLTDMNHVWVIGGVRWRFIEMRLTSGVV